MYQGRNVPKISPLIFLSETKRVELQKFMESIYQVNRFLEQINSKEVNKSTPVPQMNN